MNWTVLHSIKLRKKDTSSPYGSREKQIKEDENLVVDYLKQLRLHLENTDWSNTLAYDVFCKYSKWVYEDTLIYSEEELRFHWSTLQDALNPNLNDMDNIYKSQRELAH